MMSMDMPANQGNPSPTLPARVEVLSGKSGPDRDAALLQYFERRLRLVESEAAELRRLLKVLRPT